MTSTAYTQIVAPPLDAEALAVPELRSIRLLWDARRARAAGTPSFEALRTRLEREWAIETGLIEGLYDWDRGVTETLLLTSVDAEAIARHARIDAAQSEESAALIGDQLRVLREVLDGVFPVVQREQAITEHFVRSLHAELTRSQDWIVRRTANGERYRAPFENRGGYKQHPNDVILADGTRFAFCPPERVVEEMARLVQWNQAISTDLPAEVHAAWLHHRFVQIHPFEDGNGRVARTLATLVLVQKGLFPLVVRADRKSAYFKALEAADGGSLGPLVQFIASQLKESMLRALGLQLAESESASGSVDRAVAALRQRTEQLDLLAALWQDRAIQRVVTLNERLRTIRADRRLAAGRQLIDAGHPSAHATDPWAIEVAETLGYSPDLANVSYGRLWMTTDEHFEIVTSFHTVTGEPNLRAVSAFALAGVSATARFLLQPVCQEAFVTAPDEDPAITAQRFGEWLDAAFDAGVSLWSKSLTS